MAQPTDDLIIWASSDVNLPNLAGPNKVKPIDDLILKGWDFKQKPAADEFNYVLNNLGMHVSYLEESKTYTFSGDVTGTATSTGSEDVTFNVSVTDNSHNHISANISDATSIPTPNTVVRRDVNGDIGARTFVGDLYGNANTASALQTARTINGVSFNGSANITVEPYVETDASAATRYVTFVDSITAGHQRLNMDGGLTYNPSTNLLGASISGNAGTATKVTASATGSGVLDLVTATIADSDYFRIRCGSGGSDAGNVEIATADNGNEPIYVRQYTGPFVSPARTLTLLDAAGNTVIPGKLKITSAGGVELGDGNTGIYPGNSDGSSSTVNNLKLASWFGIGFGPTVTDFPVPYGEYSHWFNTRNGDMGVRGTITAPQLNGNASTATTLQTARTINGTSFNGSADITTSSWGTARTFGLTGAVTGSVSVDGSGNISLATTHTGFTKSVGVTGYQQLPSGMIEMWTTVIIPTTTPATWTYPQTLSSVVSAVITPITGVTGEFYYITAGLSSAVIDNIPGNSAFTAYVVVKGYL